ncbi:MAG: hypothetical protein QOE90_388 [Thermoplasmata archaeon]|nr:hypothetical protein [Thermoplasmata archaeon]
MRAALLVLVVLGASLAGCVKTPDVGPASQGGLTLGTNLTFAKSVRVDADRIASEPSIKVAADGMVIVAAPTGLIKYATRPLDATKMVDKGLFQGAIWTSKDGGKTFAFKAGLGPAPYHSYLPGGSDSDIAIDSKGTIVVADQLGLATESVSYSTDKGETWQAGSATGDVDTDRQWLWPDPEHAGTFYLDYSGQPGVQVAKTTDNGASWTPVTASPVGGDPGPIVATKGGFVAFSIAEGGNLHFVQSHDAGKTWKDDIIVKERKLTDSFPQTVADTAGTVYVAWTESAGESASHVAYVYSHDMGKTWSEPRTAFHEAGLSLFLWVAAGAPGKLGLSWYHAPDPAKEWYETAGAIVGADTATPTEVSGRVSDAPARVGEPCQGGVSCTSGRELGDFQQCAIAPDGSLVVSYVTVLSADEGGRITFARMTDGPKLVDDATTIQPWVV